MISDKVNFDMGGDLVDDGTYKSCFARSVAVNSQYKQYKTSDPGQVQPETAPKTHPAFEGFKRTSAIRPLPAMEPSEHYQPVRLRKNSHTGSIIEDTRRFSCSSTASSRRTSICSSRITEVPIENIVQQSKIETLQWQLKEIEKSREMYKAVMKQVVTFLERAHRSLELLGKVAPAKQTVPRSKSEHQIAIEEAALGNCTQDYTAFRDFTWRRPKKQEVSSEEIPPEKLSREAFRLLRTAQSLLSTQEPNLVNETDDLDFLAQLAREFPQTPEIKPQRTTSFSLSPKLILPENETKISTAFNRKLSLQLNETRKCNYKDMFKAQQESSRRSLVVETDFLSSTMNELIKDNTRASFIANDINTKPKFAEKSSSPPGGSISSVEDESGFSSMNSFQDVGLPLVNVNEDVTAKNALLRSMIHNNTDSLLPNGLGENPVKSNNGAVSAEDVKLWQKSENAGHKRWSSTPVDCSNKAQPSVKVLWV